MKKTLACLTSAASAVAVVGYLGVKYDHQNRKDVHTHSQTEQTFNRNNSIFNFCVPKVLAIKMPPNFTDESCRVGANLISIGPPNDLNVIKYPNLIIAYDYKNRIPYWVFESLEKGTLRKKKDQYPPFRSDGNVPLEFRVTASDYPECGCVKGQMAIPDHYAYTKGDLANVFKTTNVVIQPGRYDKGAWRLIEELPERFKEKYDEVFVLSGPLFLPTLGEEEKKYMLYDVAGEMEIAMPTHFFKMIICRQENDRGVLYVWLYVMPNKDGLPACDLEAYAQNIEFLRTSSGFRFFNESQLALIKTMNTPLKEVFDDPVEK